MIQAFEPSRRQAAKGASPRLIIYLNFSGLYPADEYESASPFSIPLLTSTEKGRIRNKCCFYNLSFFKLPSKKKAIQIAVDPPYG